MNPTGKLGEEREKMLDYLTSVGLGVHVGMRRVVIWDLQDPDLEWTYRTLEDAYREIWRIEHGG